MCGWGLCTFGDSGFFLDKSVARFGGAVFCALMVVRSFCVRCAGECGMLVVLEVRLFGSV